MALKIDKMRCIIFQNNINSSYRFFVSRIKRNVMTND